MNLRCFILGHSEDRTEQYKNSRGNVQVDFVCSRCENVRLGWIGPRAEMIEEVCDTTVPSKEEAYNNL